jgi:hypothetical protein
MGEMKNGYIIFLGKPGGKRILGRPRHRWKVNIRVILMEISW